MCGIAGILYKTDRHGFRAGQALIDMLDGCQHRGPDSTGFALYAEPQPENLRLRFMVGTGDEAESARAKVDGVIAKHSGQILESELIGDNYRVTVTFNGDLQKFAYDLEHAAKVVSIGSSLEIVKDVGGAHARLAGGTGVLPPIDRRPTGR